MSPSEDDADRHIMPGPPWVRHSRPRDDSHRHAEDGISEPEHLDDNAFRPLPRRARPQYRAVDDRYDVPDTGLNESYPERRPPTLEPVVMPPPPLDRMRWPALGIVIKFGGAVFVAGCAALVMMNAVQSPATGTAATVGSATQPAAAPVFGGLTEISAAQAKAAATQEPSPALDAYAAMPPPNMVVSAPPPAALPKAAPRETSLRESSLRETLPKETSVANVPLRQTPERASSLGDGGPRPDTVTRAAAPAEERRVVSPMTQDEMSSLLKRGRALIAAGDIASARLILTRLAEAGSVDACLALAGTFDAGVLADMHVLGVQPDPAKARAWYLKAAEQGSPEAKRRLQQSSAR